MSRRRMPACASARSFTPTGLELAATRDAAVVSTEHDHVDELLSCRPSEFHERQIGVHETPHPARVMFLTSTRRE